MQTRLLYALLPLVLGIAACESLMRVQRYDRPRVMICTTPITLNDATTYELPAGLITPGDTVQVLGSILRLGSPTGKYLVRVGERSGGIDALLGLADPADAALQLARDLITMPSSTGTTRGTTSSEGTTSPATDPQFGVDEKGRTLYQGPEGGIYYRNSKGKKVYVTKKYKK